jgi:AcrR family transcriptional regulator
MTRDDILQSAAQVFRQKGFHGASMADISEAVSLKKASLYHHFGSKQEILLELLNQALSMVTEQFSLVTSDPQMPADAKLRQAMRNYLQTLSSQGDLVSVLLLEYRSLEEEYYARHIPNRDRFEQMWRDLILQGVADGVLACEDAAVTARALLGAMNWTIMWFRPEGRLSIEQIADRFADVFLQGILS